MKSFSSDKIRNIALIGHSGEGKTSLAEAMLFTSKMIDRQGKVDDGSSTMDYDAEEIKRKISISLSLAYCLWGDTKINVLDVPGFFDFEGELVSALTVAETAIVVTQGSGSLTVGTDKALENLTENKKPSILFVNGLNKENSSFEKTIAAIKAVYPKVAVTFLPIMNGYTMTGYVDIPAHKAFDLSGKNIPIPAAMADEVAEYNGALKEIVAETSEELLEKFFMEEEFTEEEMQEGLHKAVRGGEVIMALGGSATANFGVNVLMDVILKYAPNPAQVPAAKLINDAGEEFDCPCDENAPFAAQVFKTIANQFVGKLLLFKVNSGKLSSGDTVQNPNSDKTERISAIYALKGKKQEGFDSAICAGDIGALAKLSNTSTSDTLCADALKDKKFPAIAFPEPVISLAVKAVKQGEEEKIVAALTKLLEEDSTFKKENNIETNETLVSGMGETQLDIICKKVKSIAGVEAVLSDPRIAYRETIRRTAEAEGKHKKQSGGAGQFGVVYIKFEPNYESEFEFVDAVVGGSVPRQFIPAVEKGLREAVKKGVLAGYPVVNIRCTLFDGKYHPVDSKEIAFVTAAKLSFADACLKADPCFLEPIMDVRIVVPDAYLGDILSDMNKRRGRIMGTEMDKGKQIINAEIPYGEMFKYATDLRSMTQGRGKFTFKPLRYDEAPANIAQKIIAEYKKAQEAK